MKRVGEWLRTVKGAYRTAEQYRASFDERVDELSAVVELLNRAAAAAAADRNLSADGAASVKAKAAADAIAAIDRWVMPAAQLDGRVQAGTAALLAKTAGVPPTDPAERLAFEMRAREIRDEWRRLDPLQRDALYRGTDDAATIDALESAPPVLVHSATDAVPMLRPFVSPELVAARRLERARAADPARATELENIGNLADAIRAIGGQLREEILAEYPAARGGAAPVDPRTVPEPVA